MYLPVHFNETRPAVLGEVMRAHPLATLVINGAAGLLANHLPLLADDSLTVLRGHVARANPVWREVGQGVDALAVFQAADGYVSPSFYPSKAVSGQVVPTWNYAVVHVHGSLHAIDSRAWVRELVETLTTQHEAERAQPWGLGDAPEAYIERMLAAIVGLELRVTHIAGKFKLSQNREAADRAGVRQGLSATAVGDLMAASAAERGGT